MIFKSMPPEQDPVIYAIPFFIIAISIELYLNWREQRHLYDDPKEAMASIGMGLGSLVVNVLMKGLAFGVYTILYEYRVFTIGWHWWSWVLILFADDFSFYWHHRLSHEIRVLWAAHVNHHSSQNYNLATALPGTYIFLVVPVIFFAAFPVAGAMPV